MKQVVSKDGTKIAFWKSGAGRPLLLVHGTTADHNRWAGLLPQLEQHFTVYAMDRRGRGSSGDAPDYNLLREAEDVAAIIESIAEPVLVLAHSYGAICSLEATLLTNNIDRLILYEPPIPADSPQISPDIPKRMQALIDKGELEAALEVFMREVVRMPEHELSAYRKLPMWQGRIQLAPTIPRELAVDWTYRFDAAKFFSLQVPTLLLLGGDSPPLFQKAVERVDSALPNGRIVVLPGQQHIAMDTNPELFLSEVVSFLEQR
ncbi:MAG: alpha/beta hydrolase [Anaerolineaceae bacterium]|nr:alpha/beta hydrolase [Anaerolineaceae bacterium]